MSRSQFCNVKYFVRCLASLPMSDKAYAKNIKLVEKGLFFVAKMFIFLRYFNYLITNMYMLGTEKSGEIPHLI